MIKIITSYHTLMQLANDIGKATLSGNKEEIAKATAAHDAYHAICMKAEEMHHWPNIER